MPPIEAADIIEILRDNIYDDETYFYTHPDTNYWHYGWVQSRERMVEVAKLAAENFGGDIAEIGCERGLTTTKLAEVAQEYGRRIIAVDPWQVGLQGCFGGEYEEFLENTKDYKDIIDVVRKKSQHKQAIQYLKQRPLCFAFVDGLHSYQACLWDIRAVYHAGIICVDDVLWDWALLRAFTVGSKGRQPMRHPFCNEGYIL